MMLRQKGLSLVELMISITLGLILLTGVMKVFLSSKTVFSTQQALSRVQETGRLGIEFISRDIRMAGYMGCASRTADMAVTNNLNNATSFRYDFNQAIIGFNAATVGAAYTLLPTPTAITDIVVLRSASGNGTVVSKNNNSAQLFVTNTSVEVGGCGSTNRISGLCNDDILIVSDCAKATVFQATLIQAAGGEVNVVHSNAAATPGNAISSWGGSSVNDTFGPGSEILSATNTAYFIAPGAISGRPSLWQNVNGTNLELLEGVENMSILYGVDTNEDFIPNQYSKTAAVGANWDKVVAVRVELLVASLEDNVLPELQKYRFDGVDNVSPNPLDRRLRQVFTTTVGIRSRSF